MAEDDAGKDVLQAELAGCKPEELQEMAKRLSRSVDSLKQMMVDLETEQQELRAENKELNNTIDLMMSELKKLNIGSDNTVEPMLNEGPLGFVNRAWERMKPRDNTYMVGDNIGEIRKPEPGEEETSPIGRHVQKKAKEVGQQLQGALGPLWSRAEGLLSAAQEELAGQVAAQREKAQASQRRERASSGSGGYKAGFAGLAPGFDALLAKGQELIARRGRTATGSSDGGGASASEAAPQPLPKDTTPGAVVEMPSPGQEQKLEQKKDIANGQTEGHGKETEAAAAPEEQISSTVLIEASITLEDGSVQTLQVRAADRCKEVAKRFCQEHSLKAWFEAPLTTWLKKVESDAAKFPVKVEGDLQEIRKTHTKSK
eukprot:TRINITY_DN94696_c0_g1_i1.p1 TRINITY_DN94696_c0_g1~~TRINITY_DN94696_c0_g1_i1.p1  ORF type:complete len:372 (-),score=115.37 TRINITY_DN94696_c0_g1_i1:56-1171(-)